MKAFCFALENVLAWRRSELERAELQFQRSAAALAAVEQAIAELNAEGIRTEILVRGWSPVSGSDLAALGAFRNRLHQRRGELADRQSACLGRLGAERAALLEARRRVRLLERLRERRWKDWRTAADKEMEALAAETHLARWRGRSKQDGPHA